MAKNTINVGINGMGVLGRRLLRMMIELNDDVNYPSRFNIVQINDPNMNANQLVYLLKHDTVYGYWNETVEVVSGGILIHGMTIPFTHIDYDGTNGWSNCGWGNVTADNVFDCMGINQYETSAIMGTHIAAGAHNVFCCGSAMTSDMPSIVFGITHLSVDTSKNQIIGIFNGDVQAAAVIGTLLNDEYTIESAICENICSYTNLNNLEDSAKSGYETTPQVGRAGAWNIIPLTSSTGKKTGLVAPQLNGKINGRELRAGTIAGAFMNITANLMKEFDADTFYGSVKTTLAGTLATAYANNAMCGKYEEDYLSVSSDAIGEPCVIVNKSDYVTNGTQLVNVQVLYDALSLQAGNAILVATYWNK